MRKMGYSFWGYLGDFKYDTSGEEVSTPDGNAFYSWSILQEFQRRGYETILVMPDRDANSEIANVEVDSVFCAFAGSARLDAYLRATKSLGPRTVLTKMLVFDAWDKVGLRDCSFILHEWRMEIPGRNDYDSMHKVGWQPDLVLQDYLIEYCEYNSIELVIFDLDYKLTEGQFAKIENFATIVELGSKWSSSKYKELSRKVHIPFDFTLMAPAVRPSHLCDTSLVYIGNRYERDWCIDKYLDEPVEGMKVFGNWCEAGRDSENKWPWINFGKRLMPKELGDEYIHSVCTILLAKEEYCKYGFMTARLLEAVFYGCLPLFMEEYGKDTIEEYAGSLADMLTVGSAEDVRNKVELFSACPSLRKEVILSLANRLKFMDVQYFANDVECLVARTNA